MELIKINNPFQRHIRDVEMIEYPCQTIQEILIQHLKSIKEKHGLDITLDAAQKDIRISINGLIIPCELWAITKPKENDQIIIVPTVAKGGTEKQILNIAIMIAAVYFTGGMVAATSWGTRAGGLSFMGTMATAVVAVGTGMLVNSLTPTPSMKSPNMDDWDSSQTYGWSPQTTQKQGAVIPKFYGKNKLYGNVIAVNTDISSLDDTKQTIKMLVSLGSGPVKGIVPGSIKINEQSLSNFTNITVEEKKGTVEQTPISFFNEIKPEFRPNRVVTNSGGAVIYTTPDADFDDLEIEIMFDRGIYFANAQGGISPNSVGIKIELSIAGANSWTTLINDSVTDDTTSAKRVNYIASNTYIGGTSVAIQNGNQYDIRVTKTTADQSSARYGDNVVVASVREVLNDEFSYPALSLIGVSALATDQLSGSLNISCIQEGAIVNVFDGESWSFEYSTNPAWVLWDVLTDPVISGDGDEIPYSIVRYKGMKPTRLDIAKFYELAIFCDGLVPDGDGGMEKRITFNGGFDVGSNRWESALKVCEIARCALVWNGMELTVAIDKPAAAVQMFTVGNIHEDSFRETFIPQSELASEIEIQYRDEKQDYERVPFTIFLR